MCPVAPGEVAILTDHRLLPLSWTRDAYFQALLLLSLGDVVAAAVDTVADHLRWLWHRARQPGVGWLRAHYAHGAVKDPVRQADQQLYPLLELLDFRRLVGDWPRPPATIGSGPSWWGDHVAGCWRQLPRHPATGMLAAAENPADDPLELPLLLSTQVLWWYTATWLSSFADEIGLDREGFAADAEHVRTDIEAVFAADGPLGPMWAYAADGSRTSAPYADANDLPTALAPLWGLCGADDPRWVATMRFAFSPDNPGYASGRVRWDSARVTRPEPGHSATFKSGSPPACSESRHVQARCCSASSASRRPTACSRSRTIHTPHTGAPGTGSPGLERRSA